MYSRFLVAILLFVFSYTGAVASELIESHKSENAPKLIVKVPLNETTSATVTALDLPESSPEEIKQILSDRNAQNTDVLVSTDNESVVKAVAEATSAKNDNRLIRFLPIAKLASAKQKFSSGFKEYYTNAKNTLLHDRIGLTVLTITVGYDSLIWIHSTSFDIQQKTSMIVMNLVLAATFGLDRDLWSRTVSPTKNRLIKIFDRFLVSEKLDYVKILSSQFVANMFLSLAIQTTRTGLLSMDSLAEVVTSSNFWLTATKISGLITLTSFAWSELYGYTDGYRTPVAKMMLKRLSEMRGIIVSQLASISMVLQPQIYGSVPTITFIVHGAIGLMVLYKADTIIEWLEKNEAVRLFYKKVQTFENFINNEIFKAKQKVRTCESLFAR